MSESIDRRKTTSETPDEIKKRIMSCNNFIELQLLLNNCSGMLRGDQRLINPKEVSKLIDTMLNEAWDSIAYCNKYITRSFWLREKCIELLTKWEHHFMDTIQDLSIEIPKKIKSLGLFYLFESSEKPKEQNDEMLAAFKILRDRTNRIKQRLDIPLDEELNSLDVSVLRKWDKFSVWAFLFEVIGTKNENNWQSNGNKDERAILLSLWSNANNDIVVKVLNRNLNGPDGGRASDTFDFKFGDVIKKWETYLPSNFCIPHFSKLSAWWIRFYWAGRIPNEGEFLSYWRLNLFWIICAQLEKSWITNPREAKRQIEYIIESHNLFDKVPQQVFEQVGLREYTVSWNGCSSNLNDLWWDVEDWISYNFKTLKIRNKLVDMLCNWYAKYLERNNRKVWEVTTLKKEWLSSWDYVIINWTIYQVIESYDDNNNRPYAVRCDIQLKWSKDGSYSFSTGDVNYTNYRWDNLPVFRWVEIVVDNSEINELIWKLDRKRKITLQPVFQWNWNPIHMDWDINIWRQNWATKKLTWIPKIDTITYLWRGERTETWLRDWDWFVRLLPRDWYVFLQNQLNEWQNIAYFKWARDDWTTSYFMYSRQWILKEVTVWQDWKIIEFSETRDSILKINDWDIFWFYEEWKTPDRVTWLFKPEIWVSSLADMTYWVLEEINEIRNNLYSSRTPEFLKKRFDDTILAEYKSPVDKFVNYLILLWLYIWFENSVHWKMDLEMVGDFLFSRINENIYDERVNVEKAFDNADSDEIMNVRLKSWRTKDEDEIIKMYSNLWQSESLDNFKKYILNWILLFNRLQSESLNKARSEDKQSAWKKGSEDKQSEWKKGSEDKHNAWKQDNFENIKQITQKEYNQKIFTAKKGYRSWFIDWALINLYWTLDLPFWASLELINSRHRGILMENASAINEWNIDPVLHITLSTINDIKKTMKDWEAKKLFDELSYYLYW